jgi:hypothetical protein
LCPEDFAGFLCVAGKVGHVYIGLLGLRVGCAESDGKHTQGEGSFRADGARNALQEDDGDRCSIMNNARLGEDRTKSVRYKY